MPDFIWTLFLPQMYAGPATIAIAIAIAIAVYHVQRYLIGHWSGY